MSISKVIHVAVAIIFNAKGDILIAKRAKHLHQGGLWEFPGGKVEQEETVYTALCREIKEEVDLAITAAKPFLEIRHNYADKNVFLDVWRVESFLGQACGMEGQEVKWVSPARLNEFEFPEANLAIVERLSR